jgi:hypothetical protein
MIPKDLKLLHHTTIEVKAGPGTATLTLEKQSEGYKVRLNADANGNTYEAEEELGLKAGAFQKIKVLGPLLGKGLDMLELTQGNKDIEGFDVGIRVKDEDGKEIHRVVTIPISKGRLLQLGMLVEGIRTANMDRINGAMG